MKKSSVESILKEYDQKSVLHGELASKIEKLIGELLREQGIRVHTITSRLKTKDSLTDKLTRMVNPCEKLDGITDICGIRVTTYFSDDVDKVAKIIETEFKVYPDESVNKGDLLDPDRFGYRSLHYIVSLPDDRSKLTEHKRFSDCKIEIQIRSILQHAWAEAES